MTDKQPCTCSTRHICQSCRGQDDALVEELVAALKEMGSVRDDGLWHAVGCHPIGYPCASWCIQAVTVLEKAKSLDDCVPTEDAPEAAASQERWR